MVLVELVVLLALLQFVVFAMLVGRARGKYGVSAPAVTGHEMFERYYRVQMNTLELLLVFLPSLWLAALHWSPMLVGGIGVIYLIGRVWYLLAYVNDPSKRAIGFVLSFAPVIILLLMALVGVIHTIFK
jgi:glutathione S-transferase